MVVKAGVVIGIVAMDALLARHERRANAGIERMSQRRAVATLAADRHRADTSLRRVKTPFPTITGCVAALAGGIVVDAAIYQRLPGPGVPGKVPACTLDGVASAAGLRASSTGRAGDFGRDGHH